MRSLLIAAVAALPLLVPTGASAQSSRSSRTAAVREAPPQRIRSVTLTPGQKCPPNTSTEIVVCSTLDQPYRIPKALRNDGPVAAKNQSWVNRAAAIDQTSRVAGGLPDTCSAIGTGGQTGCNLQLQQQWAAEQRAKRSEAAAAANPSTP